MPSRLVTITHMFALHKQKKSILKTLLHKIVEIFFSQSFFLNFEIFFYTKTFFQKTAWPSVLVAAWHLRHSPALFVWLRPGLPNERTKPPGASR